MLQKIKQIGEFTTPILSIIAAVSAFWYFTLYENIEINYKTIIKTLEVKNEALKDDRIRLEEENSELIDWLKKTPNTIPYFEKTLSAQEKQIDSLKQIINLNKLIDGRPLEIRLKKYSFSKKCKEGESFIDPFTKSSISIYNIDIEYNAFAIIDFPNKLNATGKKQKPIKVTPGMSWNNITYDNRQFKILIKKIEPLFDEFVIEIIEL